MFYLLATRFVFFSTRKFWRILETMPFSFHPYQEKDVLTYVRSLQYKPRGNKVHLIVVQGPIGCGKTWLVNHATKLYSPKITRVLRNEQMYQIFKMGLSLEGTARYIYMGAPKFLFFVLDEWVNECQPSEMDKFVKWLDLLLNKLTVPSTTAIFLTCTSTFYGNAKKLYRFLAPPSTYKKKKNKKKAAEENKPEVKLWVKSVRLYKPKDYIVEKYIHARGIRNAKRVHELQTWSGGDIRQLNLLITDRLAYLSAKSSGGKAVAPREVNVFELVRTVFEGGARGYDDDDASDDCVGSESDNMEARTKRCVAKSLQLLKGVTKEPNERILEFLLANRDRPSDQNANLGFGDEKRDQELLQYHCALADDLSFFDSIGRDGTGTNIGYVSNTQLDQMVQSMAMRTANLELEEYELDDSVKIVPPKQTQATVRWQQTQCKKAKEAVMSACFWYPGDDNVASTLSRTDPQAYLDFLSSALVSADRNYGDFSDRLQGISKEDMNCVFPTNIKRTAQLATKSNWTTLHADTPNLGGVAKRIRPSAPEKLYMPF
jgi:energy-coupling factor transporter ATP-binding protein EcfA2